MIERHKASTELHDSHLTKATPVIFEVNQNLPGIVLIYVHI